ncbi:MAG: hypothetical protein AAF928_04135 [Myxococcota bacterium]
MTETLFIPPRPLATETDLPSGGPAIDQALMNELAPRTVLASAEEYVDPYLATPRGVTGTLHGYTQVYEYTNAHFGHLDIAEGNKCGPAAALTASFWQTRTKATRSQFRRFTNWFDLGPDLGPFGTSPDYIRVLLNRMSVPFNTERYGSTARKIEGIKTRVRNGRPCLVLIDWRSGFTAHWAIVFAYDDESMFLTNDAASGRTFTNMTDYFDGAIALASPVFVLGQITQSLPASTGGFA